MLPQKLSAATTASFPPEAEVGGDVLPALQAATVQTTSPLSQHLRPITVGTIFESDSHYKWIGNHSHQFSIAATVGA